MSVRTDTVNLIVNINGNNAQNNLNQLKKKAADIRFEMDGLKKGTAEYIAKANELKQVTGQMDALKKQMGLAALSQKELIAELNKLKALKGSVTPFSKEFNDLQKEIEAVENRLYDVRNGVQGFSSFLSKISDSVKQFGVVAAAYLGFEFISSQFQDIIRSSGKLSDSLADIRRVAGLTSEEVLKLNTQLSGLDTRTSTQALREIAVIAGKLGVAKKDIFEFTASVDQLVVSLGDELGDADQITTQLGKILNVFDGKVDGDNISRLGNAFVELANAGVASGGFIADFTQRVAGISKSAGVSLGATVGLGAGLEELGQRSESSATAIQKLISTIGSDIPKAAKLAGAKSKEEIQKFANDFAKKPEEVLIKFAEALTKNKSSFSEVAASFKDAGEEGARVVGVLQAIGQNGDFMRGKIDLGNESLKDTTAISEAFALKNETFGASLDKLGKEFNKLTSSSSITGFLQGAVQGALKFIEVLKGIPKFIDDNSTALKFLVLGIGLLNISYLKSAVLITADTVAKIRNAIATRATAIATGIAEVASSAYITVTTYLTGRITLATAAQRLWNTALSVGLGPLGLIVTVIGAAVVAFNAFTGANDRANKSLAFQAETAREANKELAIQRAELESLSAVVTSTSISLGTRESALKKLIAISPEYLHGLTLENIATAEGKRILDSYNKALEASANIKAANAIKEREAQKDIKLRTIKQELEIFKATQDYAALGDDARDALAQGYGTDQVGVALKLIQDKINAQSQAVKASTDNYVNQTKIQEDARKKFLQEEIHSALSLVNIQIRGTKEYENAFKKLQAAKKKFDDEFGVKKDTPVSDVAVAQSDDAKKTADKKAKQDKEEYDRLKKEAEKYYNEILQLKKKAEIKGEEPEQAEIDAAIGKYNKLMDEAKAYFIKHALSKSQFNTAEKEIEEAQQQELYNIFQKYYKKRFQSSEEASYEKALADRNAYSEKEKQAELEKYGAGIIDKKQYEEAKTTIERDELQDRLIIGGQYSGTVKQAAKDVTKILKQQDEQATKDLEADTDKRIELSKSEALAKAERNILTAKPGSDNRLDAQRKLLELQFKQETEFLDKKSELYLLKEAQLQDALKNLQKESNQQKIDQVIEYAGYFQSALQGLDTFITNRENAQLARDKRDNDKKKNNYKKQLDDKLISKTVYDEKVGHADAELDKKQKQIQRKQAERQKALSIFNILVNTAEGIMRAVAASPLTGGLPFSAIVAALGAIQVGAVLAEPLPELGQGDWLRKADKHSDPSGGTIVKIEKDEAVMKAAAMTNYKRFTVSGTTAQITSALNSAAGGVNWAGGAVIREMPWVSQRAQLNKDMPQIMEQGGIVRPLFRPTGKQVVNRTEVDDIDITSHKGTGKSAVNRVAGSESNDSLLVEIKGLREDIKQWPTKIKGDWNIKDLDDKRAEFDSAKKASGF